MPALKLSGQIGTTKYKTGKQQTPYDFYLPSGQGGYGTPPPEATAVVGGVRESEAERNLRLRESPEYQQYLQDFTAKQKELRKTEPFLEIEPMIPEIFFRNRASTIPTTTTPQTQIPPNWMDVVNKAVGQKYQGANPILSSQPRYEHSILRDVSFALKGNQVPPSAQPSTTSPAGNNITSGVVNPTTALSGNNLATTATAPGAGTSTFGTNTSFLNPASGTATQKRKTGANKYFNQQWFGGKQML